MTGSIKKRYEGLVEPDSRPGLSDRIRKTGAMKRKQKWIDVPRQRDSRPRAQARPSCSARSTTGEFVEPSQADGRRRG